MSAFKKLKSTDAFVTTYVAKKQWAVTGSDLSNYNIQAVFAASSSTPPTYLNELSNYGSSNSNISNQGDFYQELTWNSLNQLYYSNYNQTNGSILEPRLEKASLSGSSVPTDATSSAKLFDNYEQSSISYIKDLANNQSGSRHFGSIAMVYSLPRDIIGTHMEPGSFKLLAKYNTAVIQEPYVTEEYTEVGYVETLSDIGTAGYLGGLEAIVDDGEGHLKLIQTNSGSIIGNIFYSHGLIVFTNRDVANYYFQNPDLDIIRWKSNQPIYTYNYHAKISDYEFNHTLNPTALTGSNNRLRDNVSGSSFQPYISTVGLYNDANELIAVGKLSQPLQKPSDTELTIQVKLDI